MHPTHRSRSYGITKTDMEASRLVFVFVKDAKPKRKVAVPVPDGFTWAEFLGQVKKKLKIAGVKEITLASIKKFQHDNNDPSSPHLSAQEKSGQKITSLDELQDIDELSVVEGAEVFPGGTSEAALRSDSEPVSSLATSPCMPFLQAFASYGGVSTSEASARGVDLGILPSDRSKVVIAAGDASRIPQHDDEGKYRAKVNPMRRFLQRLFPGMFAPGLPVTNRDAGGDGGAGSSAEGARLLPGRRRRGIRRPGFSLGTAILLVLVFFCLATMFWFGLKSNNVFESASQSVDTAGAVAEDVDVDVDVGATVIDGDVGGDLGDGAVLDDGGAT